MKAILVSLIFVFSAPKLLAVTFYVTNNANSGIGSLREAILSANTNGNESTTTDHIHFNITASTIDDIIISLSEALPNLSSNLVIDATTQPSELLGSTSIKIRLVRASTTYFSGFNLDGISNVSIYGFYFTNFLSERGVPSDERKAGIFLNNTTHITIGAPGKQNGFGGNYTSIISPTTENIQQDITISSNIIGLNATGNAGNPNLIGIDLSYLSNSIIGGATAEYGNLISSNENGAASLGALRDNVVFQHNVIGLDITKTRTFYTAKSVGVFANGEFVNLSILDNYIEAQDIGIRIDNIKTKFFIEGNNIGAGPNEENFGNKKYGIELYNCNAGIIRENEIAYNTIGVYMDISYPISILKNSFYCNPKAIEVLKYPAGKSTTLSRIKTITATSASGTYLPNSTVELFYTDSCPDCQGKTWFATLPTDANGNWNYIGPITGSITSMGTNPDGATSTFSKPFIDDSMRVPFGGFCGLNNGSITNIKVYDASIIQWVNSAGLPVGNSEDLTGVPEGTYYLKVGQNGACDIISQPYTINAASNGINDANKVIVDAYCNKANGSITKITIANNLPRIWYNALGQEVGRADDLINVPAGNYYFTAGTADCLIRSSTYVITNIIETYALRTATLSSSTCGSLNGKVDISGYNANALFTFKWFDEQNNEISTSEDLINVGPGKYTAMAYSANGCSNEIGKFEVLESPLPTIDYSSLQKYISCDGKSVSTTGIKINGSTGPYIANWKDENGNSVSTKLNLNNVGPGKYTLSITDKNGCLANGQTLDFEELQATTLNIPNSITPNGDGINDFWEIKGALNYPNADFSIYNRTGNRIFYSRGYGKAFAGLYNGKILPTGVYYYVIDLKTDCGKMSGSLTILR